MKVKKDFVARKVGDSDIVVATGKAVKHFNGYITLNETGRFLWDLLGRDVAETELVDKMLEEYDVERETAERDVKNFLNVLAENGILEK
ncbi:MAG: PqqD family protein [Bacillota bacterium]|nr:MAG: PqqD family protein [Bacillota bacterium]